MSRDERSALLTALAVGLVTGLGEGAGLLIAQSSGRSRWPIALWSGREVLWTAPLVDGVLFTLAGALFLLVARVARRPPPFALLAAACCAALVYDWARLTNEIGRRPAALAGLLAGLLAWALARRGEAVIARVARIAVRVLAPAALLLGVGIEWGGRLAEARAGSRLPVPPSGARDVIVIVLDTVRADHLSAYGYARRTTPQLERLAAEGVRFDACWSTSSWTLPAHASMLTGRLPWEHGAALEPLDATWPMLSEELAQQGLRTGAFSGNLCFFQRHFGFDRGFLHFDDFGWSWGSRLAGTLAGREFLTRFGGAAGERWLRKPARAVSDAFLAWIDRSPRPVFAVLNWFDAHCPYHPPPELAGRFPEDGDALARDVAAYDECVLGLDGEFGRLRAELERRGRFERAIVIVVGDHGEAFGEHASRYHRSTLFREQAQVPLIVRAPGLAPAGAIASGVSSIVSLPATILELLGLAAGPFPGPSLAPLWQSEGSPSRAHDFAEDQGVALLELARHPWPEYRRRICYDGAQRSIVLGRWHYVWHETRGAQLFDRILDPDELHDVKEAHAGVAAALDARLREELAARTRHPREPMALDLAAHPELAGIGYAAGGR